MNGYVAQRRGRFYAVIYAGRDPVTGKEIRRWHPAGTDRAAAERLAAQLAAKERKRTDAVRSLTFGAYLTSQWLPAKKLHLATSTYRGHERNVQRHILPVLGRIGIRRLRYQQIESLYESLLHPDEGRGLSPKTVYEIHLVIRGALTDAHRRGLVTRNVAVVARAPKQHSLQRIEGVALADNELRLLMRTAVGHRFFPVFWLTAMTGMRRNEVLGLRWPDIDFAKKRLHLNRGLVAVGYEVHQTRGKTKTARRAIALDDTTLDVLAGWQAFPGRRVRSGRHRQPRAVGVHRQRGRGRAPPCRLRIVPAHRPQGWRANDQVSRSASHPRQPPHQRRHPREGRQRTARACPHRSHDADLPAPPARDARRRRERRRAPRPAGATGRTRHGGTSEEQPEEDRLIRSNASGTAKAQIADLGFRASDGGGGRI